MKKLLLFLFAYSLGFSAFSAERWWGLEVTDFKFSAKNDLSDKKAAFMLQALLDPAKLAGMQGLTGWKLDDGVLELKFRVFKGEGIDLTETYMKLAHWGLESRFEKAETVKEVGRRIALSDIKSVELFKAVPWQRRKAGKVTVKPVVKKAYFCRLVVQGGKDFVVRSEGAREAKRIAMAFSALTGLPLSHNKHVNEKGFKLDADFLVIETNRLGRVKGLPMFAVIKKVAGQKVVAGDNVEEMFGELGQGVHEVEIVRPKSSKKKVVEITVK